MRYIKIVVTLIALSALLFAGCSKKADPDIPALYVTHILDTLYLGEVSTELLSLTGMDDPALLKDEYEAGLDAEADYFAYYFGIGELSAESGQLIKDLYKDLYRQARYSISPSAEEPDRYEADKIVHVVTVTVEPLDVVWRFAKEELEGFAKDFKAQASAELSAEAKELLYVKGIVSRIRTLAEKPGYLEPVDIRVEVTQNAEDGLFRVRGSGLTEIDECIIQYEL